MAAASLAGAGGHPVQPSFDDLGTPLHDVTFCVLDLETTGGSPADCRITEVGAVKVRGGEVVGTFQTLVDPGTPIPPFITILTGITQAMVVAAPPIETVLPAFLEFAGDAVLVGHNVRFDLSFLDAACLRAGYDRIANRRIDTVALARRLIRPEVRNLTLSTLAAHLRSPVAPTHRALDDATATMHVLHALLERCGSLGVTALEDLLLLPTARGAPDYRKIHLARDLPRRPGVYLFRDRAGRIIYVGKATNLRTRVTSYFHGDGRRRVADLLRELHSVDHRVCAGPLEAGIVELRLIAEHRPRYNRASRPPRSSHWVTLTSGPFPRLSLTRTLHRDSPAVLGPFRSRPSAERVMTAIWDALPIRRCIGAPGSRPSPCAPAQLGVALCPCDGSLDRRLYQRVVERLVAAVDQEPSLLLSRLEERMQALASTHRFEEAAWARDRHRALGRALEARRRWQALVSAGRLELESEAGECVLVDRGRFAAAWRSGERPLLPLARSDEPDTPVPPSVAAADESRLVWGWLSSEDARVVDAEGGLSLPAAPIPELRTTA